MPIELKSKKEIEKMRIAGQITAQIRDVVAKSAKAGMSTQDLDDITVREMKRHKAETVFLNYTLVDNSGNKKVFPANICLSVNDEIVHGVPRKNRILQDGDVLGIDIATRYNGWVGDTAITIPIGIIPTELERLLTVAEGSLKKGIEQCFAGNYLGDIGYAVQSHIEENGYQVVKDYSGHGIGRQMHEEPSVPHFGTPKRGLRLREGFVFTIEPMVCMQSDATYVLEDQWTVVSADGKPGAHFEHTIAITSNGPEILTERIS